MISLHPKYIFNVNLWTSRGSRSADAFASFADSANPNRKWSAGRVSPAFRRSRSVARVAGSDGGPRGSDCAETPLRRMTSRDSALFLSQMRRGRGNRRCAVNGGTDSSRDGVSHPSMWRRGRSSSGTSLRFGSGDITTCRVRRSSRTTAGTVGGAPGGRGTRGGRVADEDSSVPLDECDRPMGIPSGCHFVRFGARGKKATGLGDALAVFVGNRRGGRQQVAFSAISR